MNAGGVKEAQMTRRDIQVLIVAEDSATVSTLASEIVTKLQANITIVDTIEEARVLVASEAYDVVVAEPSLDDGRAASLIKTQGTPVILIEADPEPDRIVTGFRTGAADVICPAIDAERMIESIRRVIRAGRIQRQTVSRNRRLRRVSSRLIRDRRELRQRVDLICRDLVDAYQQLARKVVSTPGKAAGTDKKS